MTRLCIPADYDSNKLSAWNQEQALNWGKVWLGGFIYGRGYCLPAAIKNTGTSTNLLRLNYSNPDFIIPSSIVENYCNWSHDKTNHKFSFEFFLDNDQEEEDVTEIYDDDESFWGDLETGSGSYGITTSEETTEVEKGSSSLKMEVGSGSYSSVGITHGYGSGQDWSDKDFFCLYVYGANTGETLWVQIQCPDYSNRLTWSRTDNFSGWKRLILPLNNAEYPAGSPDLSDVNSILIYYIPSQTFTSYLDRTVVDVGQWVDLDAYVPDDLQDGDGGTTYAVKVYAWDGAAYQPFMFWDAQTNDPNEGSIQDYSKLEFLDGTTADLIYSAWRDALTMFVWGERGGSKLVKQNWGNMGDTTYSSYYGCLKRIGFALKMAPDDGQDASDAGISQCKLKLEVYYEGDTTVRDTAGRYHGTRQGCLEAKGEEGMALDFNGTTDRVNVGDIDSLDFGLSDSFTVMAKIKQGAWGGWDSVVSKFNSGGGGSAGWALHSNFTNNQKKPRFYIKDANANETVATSDDAIDLGTWYHLAGVRDVAEDKIYIYVDGVEKDNTEDGSDSSLANTHSVRIAMNSGGYEVFEGIIDEVRIYNRALSASEIKDAANGTITRDGLVAEWLFEDDWNFGRTTYEFENSSNQYYGLQNMNESWLVAFDATTKDIEFLILSKRPTGLKVRADEDEVIDRIDLTLAKGTRVFAGELIHGDLTRDASGNGVPDFLSGGKPTNEVNPSVIYDDVESFWSLSNIGSGSIEGAISEDTANEIKGTSCLQLVVGAGSNLYVELSHDYGAGSMQDWSNYKFFCIYFYGANSSLTFRVHLGSPDWSNRWTWDIIDNFTGWKRIILSLNNPDSTVGSPSGLDAIRYIWITGLNGQYTWRIDRTVVDVESLIGIPYIVGKMFAGGYP